MASIVLKNIKKSYANVETLHGIDLQINEGEFVVFVGPSGCGKSTLLRSIAGLEEITSGELLIDDQLVNDVPSKERGIAMVFQSYALYPHMTVFDNMAFSLKLAKENKAKIKQQVDEAARILQLEKLLDRYPKQLSGGQRQRVAIGRAIVRQPRVFLFDEPLSNLDAALRAQTRIELAKLHQELGSTMIYVTHDQTEAMTLADRIVVLSAGNIEQVGTPLELYHHPKNTFVAGFIGSPKMNLLRGVVTSVSDTDANLELDAVGLVSSHVRLDESHVGNTISLGIRPEHIHIKLAADGNTQGKIVVIEQLGEHALIYIEYDGLAEPVVVQTRDMSSWSEGDLVTIDFPKEKSHLFDENGQAISE